MKMWKLEYKNEDIVVRTLAYFSRKPNEQLLQEVLAAEATGRWDSDTTYNLIEFNWATGKYCRFWLEEVEVIENDSLL